MNKAFYFIRHGETDWNRAEKLQGHSDIPLNDLGRSQAESLRPFLKDLNERHGSLQIISSDLLRASETAKIASPGSLIRTDSRLREVHLGDAEGHHRGRLQETFGHEIVPAWFAHDLESKKRSFPGGESRLAATERVLKFLAEFAPQMKSESFVFFAHGLLMRCLAEAALLRASDEEMERLRPHIRAKNCTVFEFEWREQEGPRLRQIFWFCD